MNDVRKTCITGKLPPPAGTSEWEVFSQKCICVDEKVKRAVLRKGQ